MKYFNIICFQVALLFSMISHTSAQPNILLIIADDLGVDAISGYQDNPLQAVTPHIDNLRAEGITFMNVWSAPVCSPTRAAILTGKYGIKTGVQGLGINLDLDQRSLFNFLDEENPDLYAKAVIGKWHLSTPIDNAHPNDHGADYFTGIMRGGTQDYYDWQKVTNGVSVNSQDYITTDFTNESIDWINNQTQPWLLWLAYNVPHSPFHTPPEDLYTSKPASSEAEQFVAMIESMDAEIGRVLDNIPADDKENTVIIFVGDNGTDRNVVQNFPANHAKGSLYQGGVHVPMVISGAGVTRKNETESEMIHVADLHATIMELTGTELPGGIFNSLSFDHLLSGADGPARDYNYSELVQNDNWTWAIRNDQYKLLTFQNGNQEFYDLQSDALETDNLFGSLTQEQREVLQDLETEAETLQNNWSCRDYIQNGDEEGIDCGGPCAPCEALANQSLTTSDEVRIFPNPANELVQIQWLGQFVESYVIYNAQGQSILSANGLNTEVIEIDTRHLDSGSYLIEIMSRQQITVSKTISVLK